MNERRSMGRRLFLVKSASLSALAGTGALFALGCSKEPKSFSCADTTGLRPEEIEARKSQEYTDTSTTAGKSCSNCQQFESKGDTMCGTCKVLKGTVHPKGNCKAWLAKPA